MKAIVSDDGNWIQFHDYTEKEIKQLKLSLTKRIRGWYFNPLVRKKLWDGNISFLDRFNRAPIGLIQKIKYISKRYSIHIDIEGLERAYWDFDEDEFDTWISQMMIKMEDIIVPHDYQIDAIKKILKHKRSISELATSAGKTLITFLVFAYLKEHDKAKKLLIVVPNANLVLQTIDGFEEYSKDKEILKYKHQAISGDIKNKSNIPADVVIGTFQSLVKLKDDWFLDFDAVCVDEAHFTNAASVKKILGRCKNAQFKMGLSGTLEQDNSAEALTIEAFIGPMINKVTSVELFDKKVATPVNIKVIRLKYSDDDLKRKLAKLRKMKDEVEGTKQLNIERELVLQSRARVRFICDLIKKTTKNSLVLFQNVKDDYGKKIYDILREEADDKKILYVDGSTSSSLREEYKDTMADGDNRVLIASFGTFSTGISINNLHNIFFIESYKSEKIIKQSIGRGMRLHENKDKVTIIDIQDDLSWKEDNGSISENYLLKHGQTRINIYKKEGLPFKIYNVDL